jgi:ABC-type Na+ efflux pump permease subunit
MAPGPDLRIGDAERDAAAARLRESYAQGRLTLDEFNERLSAALAATTERELSQVTRDLPHSPSPSAPLPQSVPSGGWQRSGYEDRRRTRRPRLFPVFLMVALVWFLLSWIPMLRLFPVPGKLAVVLVVVGLLRGLFRRVFGRRRF